MELEEGGTMLLWDQCKECGINDDYLDTVEEFNNYVLEQMMHETEKQNG
jgi:hypothetical protein